MSKILELRRKRAEVNEKVQIFAKKSETETGLTNEELEQFNLLCKEFDEISSKIEMLEKAEKMQAEMAITVNPVKGHAVVVKQ